MPLFLDFAAIFVSGVGVPLYPTPILGPTALHRAAQICASDLAGIDPSNSIGQAGVLQGIRGKVSLSQIDPPASF